MAGPSRALRRYLQLVSAGQKCTPCHSASHSQEPRSGGSSNKWHTAQVAQHSTAQLSSVQRTEVNNANLRRGLAILTMALRSVVDSLDLYLAGARESCGHSTAAYLLMAHVRPLGGWRLAMSNSSHNGIRTTIDAGSGRGPAHSIALRRRNGHDRPSHHLREQRWRDHPDRIASDGRVPVPKLDTLVDTLCTRLPCGVRMQNVGV